MVNKSTYPILYASPRKDCAIPVVSTAGGEILWSRELKLPNADIQPALLVWEGKILATTYQGMALFAPSGDRLWERLKRGGAPVAVANGLLYFENNELCLDGVTTANKLVLDGVYLPGVMSDEYHVTFLWPMEKDFLATVALSDPKYDSENTSVVPKPEVSILRTVYGDRMGVWTRDYAGREQVPAIYVPERERLVMALDEVITVDGKDGQEVSRFKVPLEKITNWSADAAGTLCILGYEGGRKALLAMTLAGEEQWRWVDLKGSDAWASEQPPAQSAGGRVYALTERRALAFDRGKLLWEHDASGTLRYASTLADGSLLVTGGGTLLRIDRDGHQVFAVTVDSDIVAPPVADGAGNIYIVTATHLVQIR